MTISIQELINEESDLQFGNLTAAAAQYGPKMDMWPISLKENLDKLNDRIAAVTQRIFDEMKTMN